MGGVGKLGLWKVRGVEMTGCIGAAVEHRVRERQRTGEEEADAERERGEEDPSSPFLKYSTSRCAPHTAVGRVRGPAVLKG